MAACRMDGLLFVPMVETRTREHLRDDKLQRDWEWPLEDRR
jgi:hypothetical protein